MHGSGENDSASSFFVERCFFLIIPVSFLVSSHVELSGLGPMVYVLAGGSWGTAE